MRDRRNLPTDHASDGVKEHTAPLLEDTMARTRNRIGSAAMLGAATLTVLLSAACNGTATGSVSVNGPTTTPPVYSSIPAGSATSTGTANAGGGTTGGKNTGSTPSTTATQTVLKFPGTTFPAQIDSFDSKTQMVTFEVLKFTPGGMDDGHYDANPAMPGTHRLQLSDTVAATSVESLCPALGFTDTAGKPCTKQQAITGLTSGQSILASLRVDPEDHINGISEIYMP
jgi:hypothetical protein